MSEVVYEVFFQSIIFAKGQCGVIEDKVTNVIP